MSEREIPAIFANAENATPIDKDEYEARLETLRVELLNNQFDLSQADFSVVILIAGDDRPGCTDAVHALREWTDARHVDTHAIFGDPSESEEARERPGMWRYWNRLPRNGRIGIFVGGWATHAIVEQIGWLAVGNIVGRGDRGPHERVPDNRFFDDTVNLWQHRQKQYDVNQRWVIGQNQLAALRIPVFYTCDTERKHAHFAAAPHECAKCSCNELPCGDLPGAWFAHEQIEKRKQENAEQQAN